ncbi:hypothetical protein PST93_20910, partial [Yersinia pestis]|nr:hypothetical protein [Yersinia pestis]
MLMELLFVKDSLILEIQKLVPEIVIQESPMEFARVQKKRRIIKYAPTVAQARRVVTISVLMELLFVKDSLILEIQKLVPEIVIQE